jgi:hypothetical protein
MEGQGFEALMVELQLLMHKDGFDLKPSEWCLFKEVWKQGETTGEHRVRPFSAPLLAVLSTCSAANHQHMHVSTAC